MNGHSSKYLLESGAVRWRIAYDLPPDADTGNRRQVTKRGFTTKAQADAALREALSLVDQGVAVAPSRATVAQYLRTWLDGIKVRPTTLANYRQSAEVYAIPRIGGIRLQALQPEHLDGLYRELEQSGKRDGTGLAPKTVRHVHTMLRKALQDAAERGHLLRNVADLANPPTQKQARSRRARDKAWTPEQLRAFLEACRDDVTWPLWRLIAATGLRRGEALGLPWHAVDLEARTLEVIQTVTSADGRDVWSTEAKTEAGSRKVALDGGTVSMLRQHRRDQLEARLAAGPAWVETDLVYVRRDGRSLSPKQMSSRFTELVDAAALPRIGVHGLRHTYATAALRAGVSPEVLAARLGHADVATLLSIYAHVLGRDDRDAADAAAAAMFGDS